MQISWLTCIKSTSFGSPPTGATLLSLVISGCLSSLDFIFCISMSPPGPGDAPPLGKKVEAPSCGLELLRLIRLAFSLALLP